MLPARALSPSNRGGLGRTAAAAPEEAEPLVVRVVESLRSDGIRVGTGRFGTMMEVELINDGPVTIVLDT